MSFKATPFASEGPAQRQRTGDIRGYVYLAIGTYLLVFIAGFGAMLTFWLSYDGHARLGFTHYRAATFGDAIFVPILVASLLCVLRYLRQLSGVPGRRSLALVAGGVGLICGVGLQASWLLDPRPQVNWSLPRAHHFAPSGWYHGVFLVVAVSLVVGAFTSVLYQLRNAQRQATRLLRAIEFDGLVEIVLFPGWSFCLLVAFDGGRGTSAVFTIGGVLFLIVASAVAVYVSVGRGIKSPLVRPFAVSLISSVGVAISIEYWPAIRGLDLIGGVSVVLLLAASDSIRASISQRMNRVSKAVATACSGMALIIVPEGHEMPLALRICLVLLMWPISLFLELLDLPHLRLITAARRAFPWLIAIGIPLSSYLAARGDKAALTAGFIFLIAGITLGRSLLPLLRLEWDDFVKVENRAGLGHDADRSTVAKRVVARVSLLALAALVCFVRLGFSIGPSLGFSSGHGGLHITWFIAAPPCIAAAAALLLVFPRVAPRRATSQPLSFVFGLIVVSTVVGGVIAIATVQWRPSAIIVAAQVVVVFLWQSESIIGNALMRNLQIPRRFLAAIAFGAALAVSVTVYWIGVASEVDRGNRAVYVGWSLLALIGGSVAIMSTVFVAGRILDPPTANDAARVGDSVAHYRLTSALLQDAGLMTLLVAGVVWMTSVTITHIPVDFHERIAAILTFLTSIFLFYTSAFKWTLQNNTDNAVRFQRLTGRPKIEPTLGGLLPLTPLSSLRKMRKSWRLAKHPELTSMDDDSTKRHFSQVLDAHITNQNLIAILTLVVTVAGLIGLVNERGDGADEVDRIEAEHDATGSD